MRALIVGLDSRIGSALSTVLRLQKIEVIGTSRRNRTGDTVFFDLGRSDPTMLPRADFVFLCAGETSQSRCRNNPAETHRVNVEAPVAIVKAYAGTPTRIVFTSSSAVFDGTKPFRRADEPCCPTSVYGAQKADAERALLALGDATAVLRLTKTLSADFPLFKDWISKLRTGRPVSAFEDLVFAPMRDIYVAEALLAVATSGATGVFQVSGTRDISYLDAARHIASRLKADPALVVPARAQSAGLPGTEIPTHTTLDNSTIVSLIGPAVPDVFDVISELVPAWAGTAPGQSDHATASRPLMPERRRRP